MLTTVLHQPLKNILFVNTREKKVAIPNFVEGEQTQIIRFTTTEFRIQLKLSKRKLKSSLQGIKLAGILTTLQRRLSKNVIFVNTPDFINRRYKK